MNDRAASGLKDFELLLNEAKVSITHVPYKSTAGSVSDDSRRKSSTAAGS